MHRTAPRTGNEPTQNANNVKDWEILAWNKMTNVYRSNLSQLQKVDTNIFWFPGLWRESAWGNFQLWSHNIQTMIVEWSLIILCQLALSQMAFQREKQPVIINHLYFLGWHLQEKEISNNHKIHFIKWRTKTSILSPLRLWESFRW